MKPQTEKPALQIERVKSASPWLAGVTREVQRLLSGLYVLLVQRFIGEGKRKNSLASRREHGHSFQKSID